MHIWVSLLCLLAIGCFGPSTIKEPPVTTALQRSVLPMREVRVVVLTPDERKLPAITKLVREGSDALSVQVGICFKIVDWRLIVWQSGRSATVLKQVADHMSRYDKPYDIVLALRGFDAAGLVGYTLLGGWEAVIDDTYRRFIVVRRMTVQVLLHEVCHCFLFSSAHSWGLRHLMTPIAFYVLPGVMPVNRSIYLKEKDREEILRNKWRDFSTVPQIARSDMADPLESPLSPEKR